MVTENKYDNIEYKWSLQYKTSLLNPNESTASVIGTGLLTIEHEVHTDYKRKTKQETNEYMR